MIKLFPLHVFLPNYKSVFLLNQSFVRLFLVKDKVTNKVTIKKINYIIYIEQYMTIDYLFCFLRWLGNYIPKIKYIAKWLCQLLLERRALAYTYI